MNADSYYEAKLKGKTPDQIQSAICGLKNEIEHLKKLMEAPSYSCEPVYLPEESMCLRETRECLERAKIALIEAGGVYEPSQSEQKALEFDNNLSAVRRIMFSIGGLFGGYDSYLISLSQEKPIKVLSNSLADFLKKPLIVSTLPYTKDEFLDTLRSLHIGEWHSSYDLDEMCDGTQWDLEIHYSNGAKPFESYGCNTYPYNFCEFQELLGVKGFDDEDGELEEE